MSRGRRWARSAALAAGCAAVAACPFGSAPPPLETVDGPEAPDLLERVSGWVAWREGHRDVHVIELPSGATRTFACAGRVWQIAGPDRDGMLLYAEERGVDVTLVALDVRSGDAIDVLSREGSEAFWEQSRFPALALAPSGGRFAFAPAEGGAARVEVRELDGALVGAFDVHGWTDLAFLADEREPGRTLAVVRHVDPADAVDLAATAPAQGLQDERASVVHLLNVETGAWRPLIGGRHVIAPPVAGGDLLVETKDGWARVDPATGAHAPLDAPGLLRPIAAPADDLVLYLGLPTTGAEQAVLRTLQRPPQRMWTLKLAARDGRFITLLPEVGRFHAFAFGGR